MNVSPSEAPALLHTALQRLASQSASCKLWSIILSSVALAMAAGRTGGEVLIWAAAPSLLLALADAAYKVQATRIAALGAKDTVRAEDLFRLQSGSAGFAGSLQALGGLASFSVWPFYVGLATLVVVLGQTVLVPQNKAPFVPPNAPVYGSPFQPGAQRPAYAVQPNAQGLPPGAVMYSGPPNGQPPANFPPSAGQGPQSPQAGSSPVTVVRPNMPPMGAPTTRPNAPGNAAVPKGVGTAPAPAAAPPRPGVNNPAANLPKPVPGAVGESAKPGPAQVQPPQ